MLIPILFFSSVTVFFETEITTGLIKATDSYTQDPLLLLATPYLCYGSKGINGYFQHPRPLSMIFL